MKGANAPVSKGKLVLASVRLVKLSDAARQLGFHVETLRLRVRQGSLPAVRGPHGTYYVDRAHLAAMAAPVRFGRRRPAPEELEWTWVALESEAERRGTADEDLAAIDRIRRQPQLDPGLHRLLSVRRLRLAGLSSAEIAPLVGASDRHVRRLLRRRWLPRLHELAERLEEKGQAAEVKRARRLVNALQQGLEAEGLASHRRRPRPGDWGEPKSGRVRALRARAFDHAMVGHLRSAGLSEAEIDAIQLIGIGADELNELVLRGIGMTRHPQ